MSEENSKSGSMAAALAEATVSKLSKPGAPRLLILDREGPQSRQYWCDRLAAEGFETIAPDLGAAGSADEPGSDELAHRLAVRFAPTRIGERLGVFAAENSADLALTLARSGQVDAAVVFASGDVAALIGTDALPCPAAIHLCQPAAPPSELYPRADAVGLQLFDAAAPAGFASPLSPLHDRHAAAVAFSRTLAVLRPALGPAIDLGRLFREHLAQEFLHQDADATMETMIGEPYVNHIPTLTGGYGHAMLKRFYKYHFIPSAARARDRQTTLVSEIIGSDSVVLEMVISFVHDEEHEYMIPGIAPTGRRLKIPSVVVAKFQGEKLCHEHIYWDQASLLAQIGAIDPAGLPVSGAEQAEKVLDPSLPSNLMMPAWTRSADKPI